MKDDNIGLEEIIRLLEKSLRPSNDALLSELGDERMQSIVINCAFGVAVEALEKTLGLDIIVFASLEGDVICAWNSDFVGIALTREDDGWRMRIVSPKTYSVLCEELLEDDTPLNIGKHVGNSALHSMEIINAQEGREKETIH